MEMQIEHQQHYEAEIPRVRRSVESEYEPAGFWIRGGAMFLDGLTIKIFFLPLEILNQFLVRLNDAKIAMVISMGITYVLYFAITAWFVSKKGGLPGKMLLGLKIVDVETGLFLSPGKAILRESLGKLLSAITLTIGYIMAGVRMDKRALHDFVASSRVMRKVKKKDIE